MKIYKIYILNNIHDEITSSRNRFGVKVQIVGESCKFIKLVILYLDYSSIKYIPKKICKLIELDNGINVLAIQDWFLHLNASDYLFNSINSVREDNLNNEGIKNAIKNQIIYYIKNSDVRERSFKTRLEDNKYENLDIKKRDERILISILNEKRILNKVLKQYD